MGSNNPVPSRAAIHALRGLVFGTSCSVVLIAEERRRRLKTVRAAAENARKIHAAKTHRGLASTDGHLAWEARLLHRNEEALASASDHSPSPRNFRRTEPGKKRIRGLKPNSDDGIASTDATNNDGTPQPHHVSTRIQGDGTTVLYSQDSMSLAAGDGLSAWVNRLAGIDGPSPSATSTAIVGPVPVPKELDAMRMWSYPLATERSEIQRKLAASQSDASMSNPDRSLGTPHQPLQTTTHSTAQDDPASEPTASESSIMAGDIQSGVATMKQQPVVDTKLVAEAGDGLAKWEIALGRPSTKAGIRRKFRTPSSFMPEDYSTVDKKALARAGDGLAKWDMQVQTASVPSSQSKLAPSQRPKEGKGRSKLLFKPDENGQLQPNFEVSEIHQVVNRRIDRIQKSGLGRRPGHRWSMDCLLLEKLLSLQQDRGGTDLTTHIQSLVHALDIVRNEAPETLKHRPREALLSFLRHTVEKEPTKLQDHIMLIPSNILATSEILTEFVRWTINNRHTETLRQVLDLLQRDDMSSLWQDGLFLTSLLQLSANSPLSPRDLFVSLQDVGFPVDTLPSSVLTECRHRIISVDAVLCQDTLALAVLQTMEGQGLSKIDLPVARALLVRDIHHSSAASVLRDIKDIMRTSEGASWVYSWRSQLVSIFLASHEALENEAFLRDMLAMTQFSLEPSWVLQPLEHHSETGDLDKFLDWLRFSTQNGFQFDTASASKLMRLLSERWSVPSANALKVLSDAKPFLIRADAVGKTRDVDIGNPKPQAVEQQAFQELVQQSRDGNWNAAVAIYDELIATELSFSSRCLGLAVTACLNRDGPSSDTARQFVRHSQNQGHDVTNELRRLLVASFPSVSSPSKKLALASEQGLNISADLYNIVTRECISRRQYQEALQICEQSAAKHGEGKLGYNEKNFANLLRIYMFLRTPSAYAALGHLVADFISQPQWWHRSNVCKEALKYQLKWIKSRPMGDWTMDQAVIAALETALEHVAKQRAVAGNPDWIAAEVTAILCSGSQTMDQARHHSSDRRSKHLSLNAKQTKAVECGTDPFFQDPGLERLALHGFLPRNAASKPKTEKHLSSKQHWEALDQASQDFRKFKRGTVPKDGASGEWGIVDAKPRSRSVSKNSRTTAESDLTAWTAVSSTA